MQVSVQHSFDEPWNSMLYWMSLKHDAIFCLSNDSSENLKGKWRWNIRMAFRLGSLPNQLIPHGVYAFYLHYSTVDTYNWSSICTKRSCSIQKEYKCGKAEMLLVVVLVTLHRFSHSNRNRAHTKLAISS